MKRTLLMVPFLLLGCASDPHAPAIGRKAAIYIFVTVDCPISNSYAPELNRIISEYSRRDIGFYLVYSDRSVTAAQANEHAKEFGYHCPIILAGGLAKQYGITVTPEVAVLSRDGTLQYRGRIDDLYVSPGQKRFAATTHELRDVLDDIANDKPLKPKTTPAVGCPIN